LVLREWRFVVVREWRFVGELRALGIDDSEGNIQPLTRRA
jgi:hypothetical protein